MMQDATLAIVYGPHSSQTCMSCVGSRREEPEQHGVAWLLRSSIASDAACSGHAPCAGRHVLRPLHRVLLRPLRWRAGRHHPRRSVGAASGRSTTRGPAGRARTALPVRLSAADYQLARRAFSMRCHSRARPA
jgi:hypothetical protein